MRNVFEQWLMVFMAAIAILLLVFVSDTPDYPSPNPKAISGLLLVARLVDCLGGQCD